MMTPKKRNPFRKLLEQTLASVRALEHNDPNRAFVWGPCRVQLEAIEHWTEKDRSPTDDEILEINLGWIMVQELGEQEEQVAPELVPVWTDIREIQAQITEWYEPDEPDED